VIVSVAVMSLFRPTFDVILIFLAFLPLEGKPNGGRDA